MYTSSVREFGRSNTNSHDRIAGEQLYSDYNNRHDQSQEGTRADTADPEKTRPIPRRHDRSREDTADPEKT